MPNTIQIVPNILFEKAEILDELALSRVPFVAVEEGLVLHHLLPHFKDRPSAGSWNTGELRCKPSSNIHEGYLLYF